MHLSNKLIREIQRRRRAGATVTDLADRYGYDHAEIRQILALEWDTVKWGFYPPQGQ